MASKQPLATSEESEQGGDSIVQQPLAGRDDIPNQSGGGGLIYRPPPGQWQDGICDWYKNLYPSCYCSLFACHGIWLIAQIAKKTKFLEKYISGDNLFWTIIGIYAVVQVLLIIITIAGHGHVHHIGWIAWLWVIFLAVPLRLHVVQQQNLNGGYGCCAEAAIGCLCSPCSVCQMGRHVYGYTKVLDGDMDVDRKDIFIAQEDLGIADNQV
jgi:hypothetical protein